MEFSLVQNFDDAILRCVRMMQHFENIERIIVGFETFSIVTTTENFF